MLTQKDLIKALQRAVNAQGERLTVDGDPGAKTQAALSKYEITVSINFPSYNVVAKKNETPVVQPQQPVVTDQEFFGAKWVGSNIDLLGRFEHDPILAARFVPGWKICGLPGYKTLVGADHAWCSLCANEDLRAAGIKGTNSAGARSWSNYGDETDYVFGAILPIKHRSGGRHVNVFLYWIDEKKKIAATKDGNRGNQYCIAETDLSGRGDTLVGGPRWPKGVAKGKLVSKQEVLAKYPFLKVGGSVGNSTT